MKLNSKKCFVIIFIILFAVVVTFLYLNSNLKKSNKKIEKDSGNTEIKTEEQNKDSNLEIEQVGNQSDSDKENTTSNSSENSLSTEKDKTNFNQKNNSNNSNSNTTVKPNNNNNNKSDTNKNTNKTDTKTDNNQNNKTDTNKENNSTGSLTNQNNNANKQETNKVEKPMPSPTSSPSPKTQEQINNEYRNQIRAKYNVSIGYKDELDGNYANDYAIPTKIYDDDEIYSHLKKIDSALSKYPSSFFKEIKNKWKQVTIYLVKSIKDGTAGLTDNRNPNTTIILLDTGSYLFESTLHHEMMHYIDCYLATIIGASALENSMAEFNPQGFVYGNQNNDYVYFFSNPYYFISSYSKTNYKEDRAVIFEDMMFRSLKKEYYVKGNPINEKAKVISKQLSTYFDSVSDNVVEHWERFIAW